MFTIKATDKVCTDVYGYDLPDRTEGIDLKQKVGCAIVCQSVY